MPTSTLTIDNRTYTLTYSVEEILTKKTNGYPPVREFEIHLYRPPIELYSNTWGDGYTLANWGLNLPEIPANGSNHGRCDPPCHVSSRVGHRKGAACVSITVIYSETNLCNCKKPS